MAAAPSTSAERLVPARDHAHGRYFEFRGGFAVAWQGTMWSCGYGCFMLTALPRSLIQAAKTPKAHTDPYDLFVTQLKGYTQWTVCVPRPAIMNKVYTTRAPTQAERCELELQTQDASERSTFYTVSACGNTYYAPASERSTFHTASACGNTYYAPAPFLPLLSQRIGVV